MLGDVEKLGTANRYEVLKLLGDGTFGRVLLCKDKVAKKEVAVKVIRDVKRYAENAKIEADILDDIKAADPDGHRTRSAILHTHFTFNRHFCLVFDVAGLSLYDFLKENNFRGFWLKDIQHIAEQSMEALGFLHSRLQMTHTDLKPENILLATTEPPANCDFPREAAWQEKNKASAKKSGQKYLRPRSSEIKLIDFGNATYEDEHHSSIINTRQYRGPEVILSLGWNDRSDVWSMGCILMELYTGELLFGTHENLEHLALMERSLGRMPSKMLAASPTAAREKYLARDRYGDMRLNWPTGAPSPSSERHVRNQLPLDQMVAPQHQSFATFVGHLLAFDKESRPTSMEALSHAFLKERNIVE